MDALDIVGDWSELKLEIIRKYASAYTRILRNNHSFPLTPIYVDGFAGAGQHISKASGEIINGSPLEAFSVEPPFEQFYLIDLNEKRVAALEKLAQGRSNVAVLHGDCNLVLRNQVFPKVLSNSRNRVLCILDPYGVHLEWETLRQAGRSGHVEIFLNFATADMQRNIFRHDASTVNASSLIRMNQFWGDESWRDLVYSERVGLFDTTVEKDSRSLEQVVKGFQKRLVDQAGFGFVPEPVPMRNSKGGIIYHLFYAAPGTKGGKIGQKIVTDILDDYRKKGIV